MGQVYATVREAERRRITELLAGAAPDRRVLVVIEGAAGSGKTRLLDDVTAAIRGAVVRESGWHPPSTIRRRLATAGGSRAVLAWDDPEWTDPTLPRTVRDPMASAVVLTRLVGDPGPGAARIAPGAIRVGLDPLPSPSVTHLVSELVGARPSADLLALATVAAGLPGAIVELVTGLREDGLVTVVRGSAVLAPGRLTPRTRSWLDARVRALSPPARQLLQVASVLGPAVRPADLTRPLRRTTVALLPAIEEALESGLLVAADERLAFGHELVRTAVAESMPWSVRLALGAELSASPAAGVPAGTAPPATGWAGLTERERRIARLVGRGLTNRQIATRIGRSPHTVNFHLRRIFHKLGIGSRVALAAQVHDPQA